MATNQSKPRFHKLTNAANELIASFPWLKNKIFLVTAIASVLTVSIVGGVSAVQGGLLSALDQGGDKVSESESSAKPEPLPESSPENSSSTEGSAATCTGGESLCTAVNEIYSLGQFDDWIREELVEYLMNSYGASKATVEAALDSTGYDWTKSSGGASSATPLPSSGTALPPPVIPQTGLSPAEAAGYFIQFQGSSYGVSRLELIDGLVESWGFSRAETIAGVDSINIDWNQQALQSAKFFTPQSFFADHSKTMVIDFMINDRRFTSSEATYAVNSLSINWNENASRAARWILEYFPCDEFVEKTPSGESALVSELASYVVGTFKFTEDEAYSGAFDQLETSGDWTWKIFPNCNP